MNWINKNEPYMSALISLAYCSPSPPEINKWHSLLLSFFFLLSLWRYRLWTLVMFCSYKNSALNSQAWKWLFNWESAMKSDSFCHKLILLFPINSVCFQMSEFPQITWFFLYKYVDLSLYLAILSFEFAYAIMPSFFK